MSKNAKRFDDCYAMPDERETKRDQHARKIAARERVITRRIARRVKVKSRDAE